MNRPPSTYKDWRSIYQATLQGLGYSVWVEHKLGPKAPLHRERLRGRMKLLHRLERIERRLDVEHEVRDPTFYAALLEMVREWRERDD